MSNYERKYYLIRKIKAAGFELEKSNNERIVLVRGDQVKEAKDNKYLLELVDEFGYGMQPVLSTRMPKYEIGKLNICIGYTPLRCNDNDLVLVGSSMWQGWRKSLLSMQKRPSLFKRIVNHFLPKVKEQTNL